MAEADLDCQVKGVIPMERDRLMVGVEGIGLSASNTLLLMAKVRFSDSPSFIRMSNAHGDASFGATLSAPSDDIRPPCRSHF